MTRLLALVLACLFAVAPAADALCKASCTPGRLAVASCHEMAPTTTGGRLTPEKRCRVDVVLAAPPTDARRDGPAPTLGTTAVLTSPTPVHGSVALNRAPRRVRPKATQAFPRCIVLRI
ncbi:hypothetical protein TBR22_A17310 [Luteitalea sp. TBR-22]|uniref:hypothetical protein n=1 Tax=Luteitalea sp. TBR-22 TaxID=2802971 RepID=UPI001AF99610|nr:hypothetical protein [Luteitalea sp. TBR-22]BCS32516.1 hypothetical protein TBR22_A17310 [Luteitalea sp. TBR-22]